MDFLIKYISLYSNYVILMIHYKLFNIYLAVGILVALCNKKLKPLNIPVSI
jgi:hypothetical protein